MKYMLMNAKLSINHNDTWLTYYPFKEFVKCSDMKGFNLLSCSRARIEKNIIKDLTIDWFSQPIIICFKTNNNHVRVITKIKLGDKEI